MALSLKSLPFDQIRDIGLPIFTLFLGFFLGRISSKIDRNLDNKKNDKNQLIKIRKNLMACEPYADDAKFKGNPPAIDDIRSEAWKIESEECRSIKEYILAICDKKKVSVNDLKETRTIIDNFLNGKDQTISKS